MSSSVTKHGLKWTEWRVRQADEWEGEAAATEITSLSVTQQHLWHTCHKFHLRPSSCRRWKSAQLTNQAPLTRFRPYHVLNGCTHIALFTHSWPHMVFIFIINRWKLSWNCRGENFPSSWTLTELLVSGPWVDIILKGQENQLSESMFKPTWS